MEETELKRLIDITDEDVIAVIDTGYNKNHFFGYLKLQELGYKLPDVPQWL